MVETYNGARPKTRQTSETAIGSDPPDIATTHKWYTLANHRQKNTQFAKNVA
jgi:hypothetical protein